MCGIAGLINLDGKQAEERILQDMTDSLAHRGPDGRGVYIDNFIGLGHRRLSIIDLSPNASQPMFNEDNTIVLTYNGEIYNFQELRQKLIEQGHQFRSHSDTEVIVHSYEACGIEVVKRFNGMFAFAIWDKKQKKLIMARDRYGIKPLYYWQNDKVLLFSSEVKAFLKHPEFRVTVDKKCLLEYFTFQNTFAYNTLFKGVRLLPPGHFLEFSLDGKPKINLRRYWDFHFEEEKTLRQEAEYLDELDRLFKQAVKRQLVSDVEIGSFLSGGIDSASIVAIASRHYERLKTFCIGFDLSSASGLELSFDERKKAEYTSSIYNTEHHEMVLKSGDMGDSLPQLIWALEDLRLGQSYPNFYASSLASRFVKVCLCGVGGDELFAGYPWRYYMTEKSEGFDRYIDGYYKYWQRLIPNKTLQRLFSPIWKDVKDVWTEDIFKSVFAAHKLKPVTPQDYINHSFYFEAKTFLHGLLLVEDKLNMIHSLEVRVPFLDNDLVDFAVRIPVRLKLKDPEHRLKIDEDEVAKTDKYFEKMHDGKIILRKILGKYAGGKVINQHKQGFSGPDASWFKGESIDYVREILLDKNANIYNFLDYSTANELILEHINGKYNRRLFIWSLLCFEWWLRIFLGNNIFNDENLLSLASKR